MTPYHRALTHRALTAALDVRAMFKCRPDKHICVFDLAESLGLRVRFDHLETKEFEGIYIPSIRQITLEPKRPPARQRFTCAHEIGHFFFKHGQIPHCTNFDGAVTHINTRQEEFLANVFAAFLLMPKTATVAAFRDRSTTLASASPGEVYVAACTLGVGYSTLINHCAKYFPTHMSRARADDLIRQGRRLAPIRSSILQGAVHENDLANTTLYVVSKSWNRPIDLVLNGRNNKSDIVTFDFDLQNTPPTITPIGERCFKARREGTFDIKSDDGSWNGKIRCFDPSKGGHWRVRIAGDEDEDE